MLSFNDIFGQDAALEWIGKAWEAERLPHGLIFAGPAGVGKGTAAAALGALFLCEKPATAGQHPAACGKCQSCVLYAAGNHPDFHLVYRQLVRLEKKDSKARDLPIDVIRDYVVRPANLKPGMGRGKVFVIEEAELMNAAAQNGLLKTLEEPAGRALLILLTDQPNALLPTIRSRCQIVRFAALGEGIVKRELEKREISAPDAAEAARVAEGSLGLALRWLEDGVVAKQKELVRQLEALVAGRAAPDLPEWLKKAVEEYAARQIQRDELTSKDQASREGLSLYLRLGAQWFRRSLAEEQDAEALEALCAAVDAMAQAEQYNDSNVNLSLIFQQVAARLEALFARPAGAAR
jgi:DNA polymerase III subunit delta'